MIYAQKDFSTLAQDSEYGRNSLIVSFANLLDRFGITIEPVALENALASADIGSPSLGSLSVYDPTIQMSSFGSNGQPLRNDAIMRFEYMTADNKIATHYCLVKDVTTGTIIDSYSGIEKSWDVYGGPGSWAVYIKKDIIATPDIAVMPEAIEPDTLAVEVVESVTEPLNAPEPLLADDESVIIPVHVKPVDPLSWQATYRPGLGVLETTAIKNVTVTDLLGEQPDKELSAGTRVPVVGRFVKDEVVYYRTEKSVADGTWYGVPAGALIQTSKLTAGDDIDAIYDEPDETTKDKVIKTAAKIEGKTKKLFSFGRTR